MRWMIRRYKRTGHDRGAVAVVVALLMTFGLLGLGAIAIDTGSWYAEKAQLQNGADGGAIAIAQMCNTKPSDCTTAMAVPVAQDRADHNSNDNTSNVDFVCGTGLGPCPVSLCPAGSDNFVNVQTSTKTTTSTSLPSLMSKALPGNSGAGQTIHACAQAKWGSAKIGGIILAFTIAECVWNSATGGGANPNYAPSPPVVPAAAYEKAFVVHTPTDPVDPACVSGPNVGPLPGGFGWTDTNNGQCTTTFSPVGNGWYQDSNGQSTNTGTGCGTGGGGPNGVIPCARNPVVPSPPFPSGGTSTCPTPATPSPLIVPIYDKVCVQPGASSVNEVQKVTMTNATGGTFRLTFAGAAGSATTTALPFNASALTVQSALESLSSVGVGNVSVSGNNGGPYTVTFIGSLGFTDVAQLTTTGTALTPSAGASKASIAVTTTTTGSYSPTSCPAGFSNGKYFHLTSLTGFVITGYNGVPGISPNRNSWLTGRSYCVNTSSNDPPCLLGYFVKAVISDGEIGSGGEDTGVTVVKLTA